MEEKMIKVVVVRPGEKAKIEQIRSSLQSLQEMVGGYIQAIYPWDYGALICNEEGKIKGLPLNRALRNEDGEVYDIISGTFIIAGLGEDDFISLTDEQAEEFRSLYLFPEKFIKAENKIAAIRYETF